jgi:glutamate synthase (NADPH/NADH) small chain
MGKITGFMELERISEVALPVKERVRGYREFILALKDDEATKQGRGAWIAAYRSANPDARCTTSSRTGTIWWYRHQWRQALDVLHSTNNFPEFTGRVCPAP